MRTLFQSLGIPVSDTVNVTDFSIAFHGLSPGWAFLIVAVIVSATAWVYIVTTPRLIRWKRATLIALRSLLLIMIVLMLMRPVLLLTVEGTIRRSLLVLIDASASMQIKDLRQDPADLHRAAIAKGLIESKGGLTQTLPGSASAFSQLSRADILKSMLMNERLQLLDKLGETYDVVPYTFGQSLQALSGSNAKSEKKPDNAPPKPGETPEKKTSSSLDSITFNQPYTAIGDAVRGLLDLKRGQPLAGILLVTDGNSNYGSQPVDAAALAQQDKVPLYIYGVGITAPHDIIVSQVFAPEVTFAHEEAPVNVMVRSQAMNGRKAKLVLKLDDEVVDSHDITFGEDGEQTIAMKFTPAKKGDYELTASIDPLPDEAVKDNNSATQRLRVIEGKIRVLYVEQKPRWEFRYLQALLVRDRRLEPHFVLLEGDPELSKEDNTPYLSDVPPTREELMKYDVVMIGDVDARLFNDGQMKSISDLVSTFGGGLILIAGKKFNPDTYRGTPLESLFPVVFEGQSSSSSSSTGPTNAIKLDLTAAGQNSPTLRLADTEEASLDIWKKLPGVFWDARVVRAKPGAEVLLTDPSIEKASRNGPMPVMAMQSYGTGQTLFVGTDETWRWRRNVGEKYYTRLWGQMLLRFGLPRLLGASRLTQLATDKKNYISGERVTISGRLYRSGFQPVIDSTVRATLTVQPDSTNAPPADLKKQVLLQPSPGRSGYYEGEFVVTTPGVYTFATENDPGSGLDFRVSEPKFEFGETAMNVKVLQKMADTSGGAFYREEDLYKMLETEGSSSPSNNGQPASKVPNGLGNGTEKVPSPQEVELAFSSFYYALMLIVATAEWVLRKLWRLK